MTKQEYDALLALEAEDRKIKNTIAMLYQQLEEEKRRIRKAIRDVRKHQQQVRRKRKPLENKVEKLFEVS
jgi:phage shock protein A